MSKKDKKEVNGFTPPAGFVRVSNADSRLWARPEAGTIIEGECIGRFKKKGEQKGEGSPYYYQVKVTRECPVVEYGDDGESDARMAEVGETVNVQEWAGIAALSSQTFPRKVWVAMTGEKSLDGGRTMKVFECYADPTNPDRPSDKIPF